MKHDLRTVRRGRSIACVFTIGLACIVVLSPVVASAQEATDELSIVRVGMRTDLGGVRIDNLNQDSATVRVLGRNRDKSTVTAQEKTEVIALVAALANVEESTLKLEADLAPYGISFAAINMSASFPYSSGRKFKLRNIHIKQGDGELDTGIAALLSELLTHIEASAGIDTQNAAPKAGNDGLPVTDNEESVSLTGLGLTPMPFMGTGVAFNVEQLDQATPTLKPNKGESRTLSDAEAKQLRMLADSALSSMMASGGSFASGTMGTHYDFEAHGISRRLVNLSFEHGSKQTAMMIQQGEPDNPELSALLDYLFKLYE